jgi:hypothetical protein
MSKTKVKAKSFSVSFNMTNARFTIDVKAGTLEEALAVGRALGLSKALQQFEKNPNNCWDDFDGDVSSIWENS